MLSVCIITKNEEKKLKRCLESLFPYPFEIIVTDTGSTDGTLAMLQELQQGRTGAAVLKVEQFPWCSDFAAAKNAAISFVTQEYVLVLDSDEYVTKLDFLQLQKLINENPQKVGRILRKNAVEENGQILYQVERLNRFFPKALYHYEGKIHEQVVAFSGEEYLTYFVPVEIEHDGYLGSTEEKREKAYRNLRLLELELQEKGADPYLYYQLGSSYYMAGEYEEAVSYYAKGLSFDLDPKLEYVGNMVENYGYALIKSGHQEEALSFQGIENEFGSVADFHILMGFIYMNNEMFREAVEEFLRATQYTYYKTEGANSFLAYYNAGVVEECLGHEEEALNLYEKCGSYVKALQRIRELKK